MTLSIELIENPEPYLPGLRWFLARFGKDHWTEYYTHDDAVQYVKEGLINLWIARDRDQAEILVLTEVLSSARCKSVVILWCGGKNVEGYLPKFFNGIELYAKMIGADQVEIHGRPAWARLLKPFGYETRSVNLRKRVEHDPESSIEGHADDAAGVIARTEGAGQYRNGADSPRSE